MDWFDETPVAPQFDHAAIGRRVRTERKRLGLKQLQFAPAVGMSQASYSRLERGELAPKSFTSRLLSNLSDSLGKSMSFLLFGSPVRDRVRLAARGDDDQDLASRAERILELLEVDDDLDGLGLGDEMVEPAWMPFAKAVQGAGRQPSTAQGVELAGLLRDELGLGTNPLLDLHAVVEEKLGIDLAVVPLGAGLSAVAAFDDERRVVIAGVSVTEPYARQRFSLAHEVAHVLFGDEHSSTAKRSVFEMRADKFAQALLIPADGIKNWLALQGLPAGTGPLDYTVACRLAEDFGVSAMTAWIALNDVGMRPSEPAPSARAAAIVTGHFTEHVQREQAARVERIPQRIEGRVLAALRANRINAAAAAAALGRETADLVTDELDAEAALA